jgi:hypothetical protein
LCEISTVVKTWVVVFPVLTPCNSLMVSYISEKLAVSVLKTEAVDSFEKFVIAFETNWN